MTQRTNAEYPFVLVWFARAYLEETGDADFVRERFDAHADVLDSYRERYAREDGLLVNLDKWCVVEWPQNYQDGYDADIREVKVCTDLHNAINAWYIGATKCLNAIAAKIGRSPYADVASLGHADDVAFFAKRAENWRNVFDAKTGFVRGRKTDGTWREPFDPYHCGHESSWAGDFTEGNAWQWRWHVLQDPSALIAALGGKERAAALLDELSADSENE